MCYSRVETETHFPHICCPVVRKFRGIFPQKVHGFVDFQCWNWSWCELFPRILGHSIQLWHPEEFFDGGLSGSQWIRWIRKNTWSISKQKTQLKSTLLRVFPKIWENPQIIHLFIGFSIIFTIHFGIPLFLETPMRLLILHILPWRSWIFVGIFLPSLRGWDFKPRWTFIILASRHGRLWTPWTILNLNGHLGIKKGSVRESVPNGDENRWDHWQEYDVMNTLP